MGWEQAEAQELLGTCDCPSFLRKAERRLLEESERCTNYLDPGSDAKVTRVVEHRLIQQQVYLAADSCPCEGCTDWVRAGKGGGVGGVGSGGTSAVLLVRVL